MIHLETLPTYITPYSLRQSYQQITLPCFTRSQDK